MEKHCGQAAQPARDDGYSQCSLLFARHSPDEPRDKSLEPGEKAAAQALNAGPDIQRIGDPAGFNRAEPV